MDQGTHKIKMTWAPMPSQKKCVQITQIITLFCLDITKPSKVSIEGAYLA